MAQRPLAFATLVLLSFYLGTVMGDADDTAWRAARAELVRTIEQRVREAGSYLGKRELDPRVIEAMGEVPRHLFVPEAQRARAYENRPLPIGDGQTISQPSLVAMMTDLLRLPPENCHVLEIGTGSGYQAAILGELCDSVHSIEIVAPLGRRAAAVLSRLGYDNVEVKIGDGFAGWPEHAPFDAIIVTAAIGEPPPPLLEQLAAGGRLVIPIGPRWRTQELMVIEKQADGSLSEREIFPVRFVPFTRGN